MPARDIYHHAVRHALEADGWTITADPLPLPYGGRDVYVDLGAERGAIAAQKDGEKIAVEIKGFLSQSPVHDLEEAIGQYQVYDGLLAELEPDRVVYLAVPNHVYESFLSERFGQLILKRLKLRLIVFDHREERIVKWIN